MEFGIALATSTDSWQVVKRAEALGFSHAWFYDTQLLNPDVFIGMALAARETSTIRLGTGVLIPSNRLAPVAANCLATLNKLAPGRIDFGVGTGFTARRTMGQPAIRLADMRRYIDEVMGMLRGETVACELEGAPHKVRFLNPELGLINLADPVALHLSALGPHARRLTAKLGGGWINFAGDNHRAIGALTDMQMSWRDAGRQREQLYATVFALGCVLRKGERLNSKRVLAQAGPYAAVMLHNLVETSAPGELAGFLPPAINSALEDFRRVYQQYGPEDARYLSLHRGHLMFLRDDERSFIGRELIEAFTYTAKPDQLQERIAALGAAGYSQFAIQLVHGQEEALADWAAVLRPLGLTPPRSTVRRGTRRAARAPGRD